MRVFAALFVCVLAGACAAQAARPVSSCAVGPTYDVASGLWTLHITGSVSNKTVPYLRIDDSQEWTALHNQKGVLDDWTSRTAAELPTGSHLAEIIDAPHGVVGSTVVTSCTFQT